jgi:urease accessory protein
MSTFACLLILALLVYPDAALAHTPVAGVGGFFGGLLHPVLVPAHVLAIVAIALLTAQEIQRGSRAAHLVGPIAFAAGLAAGSVVIANAYVPTLAGETLLVLAAINGAWVAVARPFLRLIPLLLAALTGLNVALDSPPDAISVREAILTQLGTFCGAMILFAGAAEIVARLKRDWQRIGARILGSWLAASAILVLALKFAK